jgi:hypothetical protein
MIQLANARPPRKGDNFETDCAVYGCDDLAVAVVEVGGGPDDKNGHCSKTRLCLAHARQMRDSLTAVLGDIR